MPWADILPFPQSSMPKWPKKCYNISAETDPEQSEVVEKAKRRGEERDLERNREDTEMEESKEHIFESEKIVNLGKQRDLKKAGKG